MLSVWLLAQPLVSSPSRQLEVAAAPLMQRASSVVLVAAVTQQGIFAALWPARSMMMLQPSTGAISDVGVSPTSAHAHGVVLRTSVFDLQANRKSQRVCACCLGGRDLKADGAGCARAQTITNSRYRRTK